MYSFTIKFMSQNKDVTIAKDPLQWNMKYFKEWRNNEYSTSTSTYNVSLAGSGTTTTTTFTGPAVVSSTKKAEDTLISLRHSREDSTQYPILENENEYTDWIIKMIRQFKSEECNRLIDLSFKDNQVIGGADNDLFDAQVNHMSIFFGECTKTTNGMRLSRKYHDNPQDIWRLHKQY